MTFCVNVMHQERWPGSLAATADLVDFGKRRGLDPGHVVEVAVHGVEAAEIVVVKAVHVCQREEAAHPAFRAFAEQEHLAALATSLLQDQHHQPSSWSSECLIVLSLGTSVWAVCKFIV